MALYLAPDNPTLTDIAPRLGISPQAVNYRLSGGGATAIRHACATGRPTFERRKHRDGKRRMTATPRLPMCDRA